jgi:hypothetical protein
MVKLLLLLGMLSAHWTMRRHLSELGLLHARLLNEEFGFIRELLVSALLHHHGDSPELAMGACENARAALLRSIIMEREDGVNVLPPEERRGFENARNNFNLAKVKLDSARYNDRGIAVDECVSARLELSIYLDKLKAIREATNLGSALTSMSPAHLLRPEGNSNNVIAISSFFATKYDILKAGQYDVANQVLHAFCIYGDKIHLLTDESIADPGLDDYVDLFQGEPGFDREDDNERRQERESLRRLESEFLEKMGKFMEAIFMACIAPTTTFPGMIIIALHRGLHNVPFCAVPVSIGGAGICDDSRLHSSEAKSCSLSSKYISEMFGTGIYIVPSLSIASRLHFRRPIAQKTSESQVVCITGPKLNYWK